MCIITTYSIIKCKSFIFKLVIKKQTILYYNSLCVWNYYFVSVFLKLSKLKIKNILNAQKYEILNYIILFYII